VVFSMKKKIMKTIEVKTEDIAVEFAKASQNKDLTLLTSLLADGGDFQIQNDELDSEDADKFKFLEWYKNKLAVTPIETIEYDQCINCLFGKPVVVFNDGKFPRRIKESSERVKTGIAIEVKDYKISRLNFCFVFLKTENKHVFEATGEKVKKYIAAGMPDKKAIAKAIREETKEYGLKNGKSIS
jgi:hypothetical protein